MSRFDTKKCQKNFTSSQKRDFVFSSVQNPSKNPVFEKTGLKTPPVYLQNNVKKANGKRIPGFCDILDPNLA